MRIVIEIDHDGALSVHQSAPTDVPQGPDVNAGPAQVATATATYVGSADNDGGAAPTDTGEADS